MKFNNQEFIDALLDECFIRCVMWWKKAKVSRLQDKVFEATQTSRDLTLFQIYFLRFIIGSDPSKTAEIMDATNGKAPQLLENFHTQWKQAKASTSNWNDYFVKTGCSDELIQSVRDDPQRWVDACVQKAKSRGRAYFYNPPPDRKYKQQPNDGYDAQYDHYDNF